MNRWRSLWWRFAASLSRAVRTIEFWTLAVVCGIIIYVTMVPPIVGMADNGDFLRIMATVGLDYLDPTLSYDDKYFGFYIEDWSLVMLGKGAYITTQTLVVFAATLLNRVLHSNSVFDMRFMVLLYGALLLVAFYYLLRWNKSKTSIAFNGLLAVLLVVVFADGAYVAYFNSLFGEPVSLVFLLLTLAFGIALTRQEKPSKRLLALYFTACLFFVFSKIQNAPVGVLAGLMGFRFLGFSPDRGWRRRVIGFSLALVLGSAAMYALAPKQFKEINIYQTVFYGVLKDSDTVQADLQELGLSPELAVLANTNFFTPNTPIPQRDPQLYEMFYNRMSHAKIAAFYLKHPGRLLEKLEVAAQEGMKIRPYYLGTYEQSEGQPRGAVLTKLSLWSEGKKAWLPNRFWFVFALYVFYFGVLVWEYLRAASLRQRVFAELFALVGCIGAISFLIPVIGDGEADLAKHLFLFNVCFDVMLVSSVLWVAWKLLVRSSERV
ncbi:glycan biosynthesis hexose transferase WsfD [Paenibacillus koleovorans]|uniref:glycan biosynthesis hexose transferase WsfD n=1 Tax=Paenibacillus koleovorans TaxID=121608 RepID=UPI000FD73937|nr:hypothetical protein [Paenibacillus koleovorans]